MAIEKGSGSRRQKASFQPPWSKWVRPGVSESSMPEVCVAKWRRVMRLLSGSSRQAGIQRAAGSSSCTRPSSSARSRLIPPTSDLARDAVPWRSAGPSPGAYSSIRARPLRSTSQARVPRIRKSRPRAASLRLSMRWLAGGAACQSNSGGITPQPPAAWAASRQRL